MTIVRMAELKQKTKNAAAAAPPKSRFELSLNDIKSLFELMKANEIGEFDIEQGATKVRIVTTRQTIVTTAPAMQPVVHMAPPASYLPQQMPAATATPIEVPAGEPVAAAAPAVATGPAEPSNLKTILSPMVGTFYRAPAPDAAPFVEVGDRVTDESVLCIIEAMKLFNEIKAECRGKIHKILAENGMPVEFNQPLFLIEPI